MRTSLSSRQYRRGREPRARLFGLFALGLLLLAPGCTRRYVELPPPGAASSAQDGLPVHRVLLLHGFLGEPLQFGTMWRAAVTRLPARCEVYIVTGVERTMGARSDEGPEEALRDLEAFCVAQDIPLENLHLVGHSMGGLVSRRFATAHPISVAQVFLLGTPNGGVRTLNGVNPKGWCTPDGIGEFNDANPPLPGIGWFLLAGDYYRDHVGGAAWEGVPNDGVVSVASVMALLERCGEGIACEPATMPLTHPDLSWADNLLESPRSIDWILDRIEEHLAAEAAALAAPRAGSPAR